MTLQPAQSESQNALRLKLFVEGDNKSWPSIPLIYLRTYRIASQCGFLGSCMNWLKVWIEYTISVLVIVRLISLPTNLLYLVRSFNTKPSMRVSLKFYSIGKLAGRAPRSPIFSKISRAYFLWDMKNSFFFFFFYWENSMPRKYFNLLRYFIRKCLRKNCLSHSISWR